MNNSIPKRNTHEILLLRSQLVPLYGSSTKAKPEYYEKNGELAPTELLWVIIPFWNFLCLPVGRFGYFLFIKEKKVTNARRRI